MTYDIFLTMYVTFFIAFYSKMAFLISKQFIYGMNKIQDLNAFIYIHKYGSQYEDKYGILSTKCTRMSVNLNTYTIRTVNNGYFNRHLPVITSIHLLYCIELEDAFELCRLWLHLGLFPCRLGDIHPSSTIPLATLSSFSSFSVDMYYNVSA